MADAHEQLRRMRTEAPETLVWRGVLAQAHQKYARATSAAIQQGETFREPGRQHSPEATRAHLAAVVRALLWRRVDAQLRSLDAEASADED